MAFVGSITNNIQRCRNINIIVRDYFHQCPTLKLKNKRGLDMKWRRDQRLPKNPNAFGPLTNLPDYSFADGRPAPFGVHQLQRINKHRQYFNRIKKLTAEVDYAVERHERLEREKSDERRKIIEGKLKPKGQVLLNEASINN